MQVDRSLQKFKLLEVPRGVRLHASHHKPIAFHNERPNPEDHALEVSIFDMMNHETPSGYDRTGHRQIQSNVSPYNSSINNSALSNKKSSLEDAFKQPLLHQDVCGPDLQAANDNMYDIGHYRELAPQNILAESGPSP